MAKTNKRRRKRRKAAPHPMSAGQREPNGRMSRVLYTNPGPTPETKQQIAAHGPTCFIQRYEARGVITPDQARGVERFAMLRHIAGLAGKRYQTTLMGFIPQTGGDGRSEEERARAMDQVRECVRAMTGREIDQVITVCEQSEPLDVEAFQGGAESLRVVLIAGLTSQIKAA